MRLINHPGLGFLVDHRIHGTGIFPAAGFAEAAGAAVRALLGRGGSGDCSPAVLGAIVAAPLQLPSFGKGIVAGGGAVIAIDLQLGRCRISSEGVISEWPHGI